MRPSTVRPAASATRAASGRMRGEDYIYYFFLSLLEGAIALLIVWYAWKWPEQSTASITSRS